MEIKIAIQGIKGSFHHQVAQEYFGENVLVDECLSFDELVDSLLSGKLIRQLWQLKIDCGSYYSNYALIDKNNFT
jgi:prephenate dehydratase